MRTGHVPSARCILAGRHHRRDRSGSSTLETLIFGNACGDAATLETVEFLLAECGADASGPPDDNGWYDSSLCMAIRQGKIVLSRAIVVHGGAGVWGALEIEKPGGKPILHKHLRLGKSLED